jgi:AP-1-like factor
LKDLETKVEELEKASEVTTTENSLLRAQVERMNSELKQYKQKIALLSNNSKPSSISKEKVPFGKPAVSNLGDINFQFEFPKFGVLPGPVQNKPQRSASQPISPAQGQSPARSQSNDNSAASQRSAPNPQRGWSSEDVAKFSSIYSPSMKTSVTNGSRVSFDSANLSSFGGNTSSPSASSNSNAGPSSSCGTSPEPFTQSPLGFKPVETLTTIGEEQSTVPATQQQPFAQFSNINVGNLNNFDWLAQQNGGQFDPQLFGDYRESQDTVLANPTFDDLFNDSVDADFFTPYNMAPNLEAPKLNLIDEIDAKQNAIEDDVPNDVPKKDNMNCNQIWYVAILETEAPPFHRHAGLLTFISREKLQACPNAQSGDFDLDGLCSELTKKAKCSGTGPVVGENDFDTILKKYMGKDVSTDCVANKLGIEVDRMAKPGAISNH